jgi:uncharacterized protein (DUF3084 family)
MVEQQLFDVHADLDVTRAELELIGVHVEQAQHALAEAKVRVALAETPLAQREHAAARRRLHDLEAQYAATQQELDRLLVMQDALLAKLVV